MGKIKKMTLVKFTRDDVLKKELIIKMLNYEEQIAKSDIGKELYTNSYNNPFTSTFVEETLNRLTLTKFGYDTSDESVNNYRSIFRTYYKSPTHYDHDVINASYYMRNNRCVFYQSKKLVSGDKIPDCDIYTIGGKRTNVYSILDRNADKQKQVIIAGFSLS